jgi:hypothetical protein
MASRESAQEQRLPLILHDDTAGYVLPAACMSICGTGSRPPLAASCVLSTRRVASYGHTQEQPCMRCVRGAKESADVPGQHASGREALASREYICGTGPRPPLAASCVPSTWCVAAYGHVQEQHVPTRQEKRALLPLHDKSAGKARTFPINTPPSVRADVTDELLRNGP